MDDRMPATEAVRLLRARAHPLSGAIDGIRGVLAAVPGAVESVKWNAPNYALADDFATLQLRRDDVVQLVLHTGAKPKPDAAEIVVDPLPAFARRADRNRLVLTFRSADLAPDDRAALERVVAAWVAQLP